MSAPDPLREPAVEIRNKTLMVALVPQPRQVPLPPFDQGALHRTYAKVSQQHKYMNFGFIFDGRGAQFNNGEDDLVELRPALLRVQAKMDDIDSLVASAAQEKAIRILKIAEEELEIQGFIQCAIQILASASAPDGDAQKWTAEHLMKDPTQAEDLGNGFFGGGVRFRRIQHEEACEENLRIEPDVTDASQIFLSYEFGRQATTAPQTIEQTEAWIKDAFVFMSGPTKDLLSR